MICYSLKCVQERPSNAPSLHLFMWLTDSCQYLVVPCGYAMRQSVPASFSISISPLSSWIISQCHLRFHVLLSPWVQVPRAALPMIAVSLCLGVVCSRYFSDVHRSFVCLVDSLNTTAVRGQSLPAAFNLGLPWCSLMIRSKGVERAASH